MNTEQKLKCDMCGIPAEIASANHITLELQADGHLICSMCNQVKPLLDKLDEANHDAMTRMITDFSNYVDASAAMFRLDKLDLSICCMAVLLRSIQTISRDNRELSLKMLNKYVLDANELKCEIEKKNMELKNEL